MEIDITEDPRPIQAIWFADGSCFRLGESLSKSEITGINPYYNNGKLWFAIIVNKNIKSRVNGAHISMVVY